MQKITEKRIYSPLHFLKKIFPNASLTLQMIHREVAARYQGSVLGVFWSFLNPLVVPKAMALGKRAVSFADTGASWRWSRLFGYSLSGEISPERLTGFLRKMIDQPGVPACIGDKLGKLRAWRIAR